MTKIGYKQTPEHRANIGAGLRGYKQTPEHIAKHSASLKKALNTPEAKERMRATQRKRRNTPEIFAFIDQYGPLLIKLLRGKYWDLNYRCNRVEAADYKYYGGRGIKNLFPCLLDFLTYVINELHITSFSQIDGLDIDRIDNDSHYMPGNIHFVTHKENTNNRHKRLPTVEE